MFWGAVAIATMFILGCAATELRASNRARPCRLHPAGNQETADVVRLAWHRPASRQQSPAVVTKTTASRDVIESVSRRVVDDLPGFQEARAASAGTSEA